MPTHKCVFDVVIDGEGWQELPIPHPYGEMYTAVVRYRYPVSTRAVTVEYETDAEWGSAEDYRDAVDALRQEMKEYKVWQFEYWTFVRPEDC